MEILKSNIHEIEEHISPKARLIDNYENNSENSEKNKIVIVPFKNYFLKIYTDHDHYFILDRHKYDINAVMMLLDLNKINKLSRIFQEYKDGIQRLIFVNRMKSELPCNLTDPMDETNLVYGLYKFFKEVDFNGDNQMQWNEFTQFIIDKVEGDSDAKVNQAEGESTNKLYTEKQMIKFKRYHESKKIYDNIIHKTDVISAVFIPKMESIILNEYNTKMIKIYSPKTGKCEKTLDLDEYINPKLFLESNKKYVTKKQEIEAKLKKKKKGNKKFSIEKNTNYTILYIYQYQTILAMCLSDKRIVFVHYISENHFQLVHEIQLPFLEKRIWFLPEHNIWVSSGCKYSGLNYFTLNELDIEMEYHNQKYQCLYNEGHPFRYHYCDNYPHMGEILDCIEITKPMLIITACMDSKIRLININEKSCVQTWNQHSLGVRSLNFNPYIENNGYILSVGFEYFINIYCTDISLEESYRGKLEGHYAPVITAKFLSNSYMAVSVDEDCCVRIWDVKNKICLQVIPTVKKNLKIVNLLCLPKYNKFMAYGNKIIYYDPNYKEEKTLELNDARSDNYPVLVEYNYYYQQFFVVTRFDIRVYNKDGYLDKIYRKLIMNDHFEVEPTIKYFLFENNYRKFYVGYSNGAIMQYNAGNGSLIKPINEKVIDKEGLEKYVYSHSKEISSLYYYYSDEDEKNQNLLLLSSSYDSTINIFNEENPEESIKLKTIRGGHTIAGKHKEINCLDFSKILYSYATGSNDGLVVVWDFEISKINDIFYIPTDNRNEKLNTILVKFLDPYPLLASAYDNGTLYIWAVKQSKDRGECILRARNYFKYLHKIDICPITSMDIFYGDLPDIKNKEIQLYQYFEEDSPFMKQNLNNTKPRKSKRQSNKFIEKLDEKLNLDIVPDIYKNEVIDKYNDPDLYDDNNNNFDDENINEDPNHIRKRFYLIIGDSVGDIKVIDIYGLIKKNKYEKASKIISKSSFNILKKEDINVETILNHELKIKDENSLPKFTNLYYKMICFESKIHHEDITSIRIIYKPLNFITSSKDKYIKIFNFDCECIGVINSLPKISKYDVKKVEWNFKINEEKILEDEIIDVVKIFENERIEKIKVGSKLDKEINDIDIEEKIKQEQERKKKFDKTYIKRKFKYLEKEQKKKNRFGGDDKTDILYEDYFVREAQKDLEKKFVPICENQGMNEIATNLINSTVEIQNEEKIRKEKEKEKVLKELDDMMIKSNEKKNKKKTHHKKELLHLNSLNSKKSVVNVDLSKTYNPNNKDDKQKENLILNSSDIDNNEQNEVKNNNIKNQGFNNIKQRSFTINLQSEKQKNKIENMTPKEKTSIKFLPTIFEKKNETINDEKESKNNVSKLINEIEKENKSRIKTPSNNSLKSYLNFSKHSKREKPIKLRKEIFDKNILDASVNKKDHNIKIQNSFFFEHFLKKKEKKERKNNSFANRTTKNGFLVKLKHLNLDTPYINDKIIFSKGETEKLLNYQFYKTSYNACCDINKHRSINNESIKTNYHNNWSFVKYYTYEKKLKNRKLADND